MPIRNRLVAELRKLQLAQLNESGRLELRWRWVKATVAQFHICPTDKKYKLRVLAFMNIIFASSKGGVGKSTSCACVAAELALEGRRVLLLDLDQNRTLDRWARRAPFPNLTVTPVSPQNFSDAIKAHEASGRYDHICVDLPGTREVTLYKALARADLVVIPAQASEPDLREALVIVSDIHDVAETAGRGIPYRLLLTKVFPLRTRVTDYAYAELDRHKLPRFQTALVERSAYREMFLTGAPPTAGEREKGAAIEIRALVAEIECLGDDAIAKTRKAG